MQLDNCQAVVLDEVDILLGETSAFMEQVRRPFLDFPQNPFLLRFASTHPLAATRSAHMK